MNLIPNSVHFIHGASGFSGRAVVVNAFNIESSIVGIIFGGLINGNEKLGFILIDGRSENVNSTYGKNVQSLEF